MKTKTKMKTVALEDLVIITVLGFCENAAELGCPQNAEVDMWFRELDYKNQLKVSGKLIDIIRRSSR